VPRTREGYYHFTGGLAAATKRVAAFAPHADLLWLETKTPDLAQARKFAREVRAQYPDKCVAGVCGLRWSRLMGVTDYSCTT
jgi:isocitrate lyase